MRTVGSGNAGGGGGREEDGAAADGAEVALEEEEEEADAAVAVDDRFLEARIRSSNSNTGSNGALLASAFMSSS